MKKTKLELLVMEYAKLWKAFNEAYVAHRMVEASAIEDKLSGIEMQLAWYGNALLDSEVKANEN